MNSAKYKIIVLTAILLLSCYVSESKNLNPGENNEQNLRTENTIEATKESNNTQKSGIIGGKRASIKKYPFTCAVIVKTGQEGTAAILNNEWVVTSAWTLIYELPEEVLVRCGSSSAITGGQAIWADKLITHPKYSIYKHNVGLIKLKKPLKFGKCVAPIRIATGKIADRGKAVLIGFGAVDSRRHSSEDHTGGVPIRDGWLRSATFKLMSYSRCKTYYEKEETFTAYSFCSNVTNNLAPCTFDDGEPLVYKDKLVGVFAGSVQCPDSNYPAIYTDVSKYRLWIESTIKGHIEPEDKNLNAQLNNVGL